MSGWMGSVLVHASLLAGLAWLADRDPLSSVRDPVRMEVAPLEVTMEAAADGAVPPRRGRAAAIQESRDGVERPTPSGHERPAPVMTRPEPRRVPRVARRIERIEAPSIMVSRIAGGTRGEVRSVRPPGIVRAEVGRPVEASPAAVDATVAHAAVPEVTPLPPGREPVRRPLRGAGHRIAEVTTPSPAVVSAPVRTPSQSTDPSPTSEPAGRVARAVLQAAAPESAVVVVSPPRAVAAAPAGRHNDGEARLQGREGVRAVTEPRPSQAVRDESGAAVALSPAADVRVLSLAASDRRVVAATGAILGEEAGRKPAVTRVQPSRRSVVARTESRLARDTGWVAHLLHARIASMKRYPEAARVSQLEGRVVLRVVVRHDGDLAEVRVTRSSGHEVLDRDALTLLRRASPLAMDRPLGQPYIVLSVPISYRLR